MIHIRDPASLNMCDGNGDGKKWKFKRYLGLINRSWRATGLEEGYKDSLTWMPEFQAWQVGSGAFDGAYYVCATDVPQCGLVGVSHMRVD